MSAWYKASSGTTQCYIDIEKSPSLWIGGSGSSWTINALLVTNEDVLLDGTYSSQQEALDALKKLVHGVDLSA